MIQQRIPTGSKTDTCSAQAYVRFTPKADMCSATRDVRFVPIADIARQGSFSTSARRSATL